MEREAGLEPATSSLGSRLPQIGVLVELQDPGTFHGSSLVAGAAVSQDSTAEMVDAPVLGLSR